MPKRIFGQRSIRGDIEKMNRENLVASFNTVRHFIDDALGISKETRSIAGFEYAKDILEAAAYNTYLETNSKRSDNLYGLIKYALPEMAKHSYLNFLTHVSKRTKLSEKNVILAFDYTDENFYGEAKGFDIYGWTGKNGITGKFKFLTCSIVAGVEDERIPLISIPVHVGHNMAHAVTHCLYLIQNQVAKIELILFDRGFYSNELMYDLDKLGFLYLIFVQKYDFVKEELESMSNGDKKIIEHPFDFRKFSEKKIGKTTLAFLKGTYSKRLDKNIDWVFSTNCEAIRLDELISTYRKRWQIETNFRVQDEATIKCKSTDMKIRYFFFILQQVLQTLWMCIYKQEVSFKKFVIELHKVSEDLVKHAKY